MMKYQHLLLLCSSIGVAVEVLLGGVVCSAAVANPASTQRSAPLATTTAVGYPRQQPIDSKALLLVNLPEGTQSSKPPVKKEDCGNFWDDDGDGMMDCADPGLLQI